MNWKRPHTPLAAPYTPRQTRRRPRATPPHNADAVLDLTSRLTERDYWLLDMLHTHRVLTSTQILRLAFDTRRTANRRLRMLYHHGIVDSFRPLLLSGSAPEHYTLGRVGANILAVRSGTTLAELGWRPDHTVRTAYSPWLGHTLGVNEFFTRLAAEHRRNNDRELTLWLPERICTQLWGDWTRPDGYGHYREGPTDTPFFLEYDTGTEDTAGRLDAKLHDYARLTQSTRTRAVVLLHVVSSIRERHVRSQLRSTAEAYDLPVATTSAWPDEFRDEEHSPAEARWRPLESGATPLRLAELSGHWPDLAPALPPDPPDSPPLWRSVPSLPPAGSP